MYICICRAVTDGQIKEAAEKGTKNFRDLCKKLDCCNQCGTCARSAKEIFDQAKQNRADSSSQ